MNPRSVESDLDRLDSIDKTTRMTQTLYVPVVLWPHEGYAEPTVAFTRGEAAEAWIAAHPTSFNAVWDIIEVELDP
jgi:hypothetical protein